jgi:DNA primase
VWSAIAASGGPVAGAGDPSWSGRLRDAAAADPAVASAISELSVEPLPTDKEPNADYVLQYVVRLLELTTLRRIEQVKSKMQRTNPVEHDEAYRRMFGELAALEEHRRKLRDRIVGTQ